MRILSAVVLLSIFFSGCYHSHDADLVVHNAIIHSMDENNTTYQAMAIRDGRIVELGPERQILNRYASTKHYDAGGQVVFPGFIDGHCHFFGYGLNKTRVQLRRSSGPRVEPQDRHGRQVDRQSVALHVAVGPTDGSNRARRWTL